MATAQTNPTQPYKTGTPVSNQQFSPTNRLDYRSSNTKGLSEDTYLTKAESKAVWTHRKLTGEAGSIPLPRPIWQGLHILNTDFHLCMSLKGGQEFIDNTCLCTKQVSLLSVYY